MSRTSRGRPSFKEAQEHAVREQVKRERSSAERSHERWHQAGEWCRRELPDLYESHGDLVVSAAIACRLASESGDHRFGPECGQPFSAGLVRRRVERLYG